MVEIKITTYEQDRLEHFTNLMKGTQRTYNRFYKKFKYAQYLSAGAKVLSDAGRELQFYKDVVEMLENGYRKQEWISVEDRLPEDGGMYLVYNPERMVSKVVTARYSKGSNRWCSADACCYHEGITHWMPLPEPPKMKGGAE